MLSITVAKLALAFFLFIVLPLTMIRYAMHKAVETKDRYLPRR